MAVNGERYAGSGLKHTAQSSETDGETLRLLSAGQVLVEQPAQGWSFATAGMSEPEEDKPAATAEEAAQSHEAQDETEEGASAEADVAAAEAEMAAATAPEPAAPPQCVEGELSVVGFGIKETAVPEPEKAKIEEFLALAGKDCPFEVVGYSSSGGPVAVNMQISGARAEAVAQSIISSGVSNKNVIARGAGPTTSFGEPRENRRVTVAVAP